MKPKLKNLLKFYKQFLPYKTHQLQHNALQEVFTVLPNLRKQISLICFLTNLNISQPKHGFRFILVPLYKQMTTARVILSLEMFLIWKHKFLTNHFQIKITCNILNFVPFVRCAVTSWTSYTDNLYWMTFRFI
jgi:hypothetical protein